MRKMKDSGIHWIGKIPEDWALEKLKFCANLRVEKIAADSSEDLQYVGLEHVEPQSGRLVSDYEPIFDFSGDTVRYHKDDVLFGKLRPYLAKAYKADEVGKCSSEFFVMSPASVSSDFLAFLVLSKGFVDAVNGSTFGVKMPRAEWEFVGNMKIPLPSLHRQKIIASFLANRCGQIDSVIAAKEKTNEALKAYRQSVIYEAVTKGLDPAAPLKDTNIPWIGKIPESWSLWRLKHLAKIPLQYGANESGEEFDEFLPRYIRITDINSDNVLKSDDKLVLSEQKAEPYLLHHGDVLFARSGATAGKSFYYRKDMGRACFAGYMIRLSVNEKLVSSKLIYYFTLGSAYLAWVSQAFIQATIQNISAEKYNSLAIPLPDSLELQHKIVSYLDDKCGQIDAVIAANESIVKKLREYRQSLIYEAVTGKIACD